MKREILFRGKQIANGEFIEGSLTVDCHGNCCIYHPLNVPIGGGFQYFDVDPNTIGQFTGMTDKHGTKIFEDDRIREIHKGHDRVYHVFWDEYFFAFRTKYKDITYYLDEIVSSHCEVIGNVFENKELLK